MLCQVEGRVQSHNNAYEDWSIGSKDDGRNSNQIKEIAKRKKKIDDMLKEFFEQMERNALTKKSKTKKQHSSRWTTTIYSS